MDNPQQKRPAVAGPGDGKNEHFGSGARNQYTTAAESALDARTFTPTGDLPEALTERSQWICWQYRANGCDKPRKVPCTPNGGPLNEWQKNPAQWLSHDDAVTAYQANEHLAGIGFVLTPDTGVIGVDMDNAIDTETGEMADWARAHLADFDTYAEVSPSRTGLRLFVEGNLPDGCSKKSGPREIYDGGRWLTVTGKTMSDEPVRACPEAVGRYLAAMQPDKDKGHDSAAHNAKQRDIGDGERNSKLTSLAGYLRRGGIPENEVLALLLEANASRCQPPLSEDEVKRIAHSVCRYEPDTDAAASTVVGKKAAEAILGPKRQLVAVPCADLSKATRPPVHFVMEPYFPRRQVTLFGGHGGIGKTYLGLAFAAHIATGTQWAGHVCEQGRVLFISLEDEPDICHWRLAMVCEQYGLPMAEVRAGIDFMDGTATAATLAIETGNGKHLAETQAWRDIVEQADGYDCIMVDNASDALTANGNDPALVRMFLRKLQTLARSTNAASVLLAHIDKASAKHGASGNSYIGTTAWHNTVRSRIALVDDDGAITLEHEKANLGGKCDTVYMRKVEHGVPMPMSVSDIRQDAHAADALLAEQDAPDILEYLRKAIGNGENVPHSRYANNTAWHLLRKYHLPACYDRAEGKRRFWLAMDWLYDEGYIENQEYKNANYKWRKRIVTLADFDQ